MLTTQSKPRRARFSIGQTVRHKSYRYRGIVVDVDPSFRMDDAWYADQTERQPPKDKPWYHVLVDQTEMSTYVAERNLLADDTDDPIDHPEVEEWFNESDEGLYTPLSRPN
ncbi:heat shock protein HspQ [Caenispirillum salinarum]|uniref:heat shock protein HspQ n=1 Tax=Caenispirillum salinarum TaxID=859058 RepID=UPI00384EB3F1